MILMKLPATQQRGINPGTSSPSPLLLKEKGAGVEVDRFKCPFNL
jgi:hypothetical protein